MYICIYIYIYIYTHHQLVTCLDDDEDLVKIEKLKQLLSIVLKLSIESHFLLLSGMANSSFIYIYL